MKGACAMITIHPELQSLIPPLTAEEYAQLEQNLLADGCRDPLIVWREEQTLLDGHNRYEICERHGLTYTTVEVSLPDLESAKAWMIDNQLGRRNLTPEQTSYFRGKQYALYKQVGFKGNQYTSASGKSYQKHDTAKALAERHHVAEKTIRNDAAYANAIDTIVDVAGPEARQTILARETKVTQKEVKQLADMVKADPQAAKEVLVAVQAAPTRQAAQAVLTEVLDAAAAEPDTPAGLHRNRWGSVTATPADTHPAIPRRVSSGDFEWYTPAEVVTLVRQVLGAIDIDPASCDVAQQVVGKRSRGKLI